MRSFSLLAIAGLAACAGASNHAAEKPTAPKEDARSFVEAVYRAHDPNTDRLPPWLGDRCRLTFTSALCGYIEADILEAQGEVGRLDGDPLYDAQDFEIRNLAVTLEEGHDARARIKVSFENLGHPQTLHVYVVRESGGWRIADIEYERSPHTLTELLRSP